MSKKGFQFDDFSRLVDEDYSWRRKELQLVKTQIPKVSSPLQKAMLRSAIPILYAHWEGFVKKSCDSYLKYVSTKFLKHNELKPQFIALSLTNTLKMLDMKNMEEKSKTVEFLLNEMGSRSNIPVNHIIQTKSNLKFDVLEEILFILGLDLNKFKQYKDLIDTLVETRNKIAHGNYLIIGLSEFESTYEKIQLLMEILKDEIQNSALMEEYKVKSLASSNVPPVQLILH